MNDYKGQGQDKFILNILNFKKKGIFIELGSGHPIEANNTYILEKKYDWTGIMIESNEKFLNLYKKHRKNSIQIINDATKINYLKLFDDNNLPSNIDYLQIDLVAGTGVTLEALNKLDEEIFDKYTFSVVTFEHDVYNNKTNTREKSREIFSKRGYICVFQDISFKGKHTYYPFEDWYVHPDLVNMNYVNDLIENNKKMYVTNNKNYKSKYWEQVEKSINYKDIKY